MLRSLAGWWDGVELWLTQLTFPVQVVLVVAVIGPLCWGTSAVIDAVVERSVAARLAAAARRREALPDASPAPVPPEDTPTAAPRTPG